MRNLFAVCLALLPSACGGEVEPYAGATASASSTGSGAAAGQGGTGSGAGACDPGELAPKLHYRFDNDATNSGELGAQYDGVSALISYVEGKVGQAAKFDGPLCNMAAPAPSTVDLPGTAGLLQSYPRITIGLWYRQPKPSDTDCVQYLLKCRGGMTGTGFETYRGISTPNELFTCYTAGDTMKKGCGSFLGVSDAWHHLLYRYAGSATGDGGGAPLEIYLDNELVLTLANAEALAMFGQGLEDLSVGRFSFFEIDELKIYDDVFDAETQCTEVIGGCWTDGACVLP
jgi:hypothetical protein